MIFRSETKKKKHTSLFVVELLAVTCVPCISRHPILMGCIFLENVLNDFISK